MKKNFFLTTLILLCMVIFGGMSTSAASARWEIDESGNYVFYNKSGKVQESRYFPEKGAGFVYSGKYWYCYLNSGKKFKGMFKDGNDWYYFKSSNGRMVTNRRFKVGNKYYYFRDDGVRVVNTWVEKRYYGKNGAQVKKKFVDNRYVGSSGKYVTGLQRIKGNLYYFDPKTGYMVKNQAKTVNGVKYYFNSDGIAQVSNKSPNGVTVESTYFTDPQVSDEELLAAIIYCEAGNQPYYGQLAVGLVVMNRVKSPLCPPTMKEVIYAKNQFEPARNSWLTGALTGKIYVTDGCRKAAKEAISRSASGNLKIKTENDKKVNMKGYLFFMTPASFVRLGLKSQHIVLKDHVFFKLWG